ncbi:hypothetical protein HMPREF9069_00070 [Atopobium sp. oral taxon 810 str. F0209]|nr:hypothetical protein HMPREF9069_00070 [Atopobium sp. oral taxon 810 str. F0209]
MKRAVGDDSWSTCASLNDLCKLELGLLAATSCLVLSPDVAT